jgi:hypothetical protein
MAVGRRLTDRRAARIVARKYHDRAGQRRLGDEPLVATAPLTTAAPPER